jgi:hemolysin D
LNSKVTPIVRHTLGGETSSACLLSRVDIAKDAIVHDKPQDKSNDKPPGAESSSSGPKGQELIYAARISLDRTQMQIDDNLVNLSPGMAVTAEIKTGSRTVISYLLSPLLRYQHESLHER